MSQLKKLILVIFILTGFTNITFAQPYRELAIRADNLSKETLLLVKEQPSFTCILYYTDSNGALGHAVVSFMYNNGSKEEAKQYLLNAQKSVKNAFDDSTCIKKNETQEFEGKIQDLINSANNSK